MRKKSCITPLSLNILNSGYYRPGFLTRHPVFPADPNIEQALLSLSTFYTLLMDCKSPLRT